MIGVLKTALILNGRRALKIDALISRTTEVMMFGWHLGCPKNVKLSIGS